MSITVETLDQRFEQMSNRLKQALLELRNAIQAEAEAERNAVTDKIVAAERERAHLAAGMTKAAFETVRSIREQMSNLRTVAQAQRSADFARNSWNNDERTHA